MREVGRKQGTASPCAACKLLRRRCAQDCVFAPHFPADEPQKFASVHKVFGASNVSKLLQELPAQHRGDAVSSLVYEANARVRDPVYGCVGAIASLQRQVEALQAQLALSHAHAHMLHLRVRHQLTSAGGGGGGGGGGGPLGVSCPASRAGTGSTSSNSPALSPPKQHHHHLTEPNDAPHMAKAFFELEHMAVLDQTSFSEAPIWSY